jgi:hypothetical protein
LVLHQHYSHLLLLLRLRGPCFFHLVLDHVWRVLAAFLLTLHHLNDKDDELSRSIICPNSQHPLTVNSNNDITTRDLVLKCAIQIYGIYSYYTTNDKSRYDTGVIVSPRLPGATIISTASPRSTIESTNAVLLQSFQSNPLLYGLLSMYKCVLLFPRL